MLNLRQFQAALRAIGITPPASRESLSTFLAGRNAAVEAPRSKEAHDWRSVAYQGAFWQGGEDAHV